MNKAAIILIIIMVLVFSWGCARTVTQIIQFGSEVSVEVNFRGNLDTVNNTYYMIIGTSDAYQLPFNPYEFIEPGDPPTDPTYDPYVYYQSWQAYIILDSSGNYFLVPGPFQNSGETYSRINIGNIVGATSNKLEFSFRLDQIYGTSVPDEIYFDFVAVDSSNFLKNHLQPPSKYLDTYRGSEILGSDDTTTDVDASLDILGWRVRIE